MCEAATELDTGDMEYARLSHTPTSLITLGMPSSIRASLLKGFRALTTFVEVPTRRLQRQKIILLA